jgi:hypothetical protein
VVENVHTIYQPVADCHPNAIHYYPSDDTYTVSDRNPNLFVKFTRQGVPLWQFGGENPVAENHFVGTWTVNHGHQLLSNGNFVFFNNTSRSTALVLEYTLDESTWTATEIWRYESTAGSATLGDAQRLPNGNTVVTYSNNGVIHEVDADANLVQSFTSSIGSFGYADFRPTLYGPPLR